MSREPKRKTPIGTTIFAASLATGLALGVTGLFDSFAHWSDATQFTNGASRVRFELYVFASHFLIAALLGAFAQAGVLVLLRLTRFGEWVEGLGVIYRDLRSKDPRRILGVSSVVLAFPPSLAVTILLFYKKVMPFVTGRHSMPLVVLVVISGTLVASVTAIPLGLLLGRLLEVIVWKLARTDRSRQVVSWAYGPMITFGALVLAGISSIVAIRWNTTEMRELRGILVVAMAFVALVVPSAFVARRLVKFIADFQPRVRVAIAASLPAVLLVLVLASGNSPGVIKAAYGHTQLGGTLTGLLRRAFDWDHDGYARFLVGGDCDDGNRAIHPGAHEIAGDGIDQNCLAGDGVAAATPDQPSTSQRPNAARPNILFLTIDTLRADHVGAYGYKRATTPALDKLAAESFVFENAWAHASSTYYSMPAMFTGRLPLDVHTGAMLDRSPTLSADALTLAEVLSSIGFYTGAILNLPYFEPARKFDQGFAHYDNENARLHARAGVGDARGWSAQEQTNKAITFLANNRARRWFLWVHYFEPHYRYERHPMSATFGESERDLYDGEIRFTDDEVGRLLGYLRERGLFDNTIIVVTSDHGEGFGEHGVEFHARHLYAAQTRVPMLLRVPGRSPQRISTPIGHIDLSPTLLDIIGEPSPSDWMGRSVTSALDGGDEKRVIFQQLSLGKGRETRGAASDKCHVLYHIRPDATWEVYRVDIDPAEMIDRSDDPTVCADTRRALEAWCEQGCD